MTQAAANSIVPRDAALAIVSAQPDTATNTSPIVRFIADNAWLRFAHAAAATGTYKFFGSLDGGVSFSQLSLPAALIVHNASVTSGAATLSGNTISLAAAVGSFLVKLCGLPPYFYYVYTAGSGGAATNCGVQALSSEEGDGY